VAYSSQLTMDELKTWALFPSDVLASLASHEATATLPSFVTPVAVPSVIDESEAADTTTQSATDAPAEKAYLLATAYSPKYQSPVAWGFKRFADIALTVLGGAPLLLPLLLVALLVKVTSKGPVLFKQERIGFCGNKFYMYKFRSMYTDAEERLKDLLAQNETNGAMFKMKNDPRITPLGKVLRKFSIDEFPQLINVLKGEMSLVGFRPPIERELEAYKPWHYVRFSSMPGMTGPWQVGGRSAITCFDDVVRLEFNYAKSWGLMKDLKILFQTVAVVLFAKNTA
jgi:lipopolysaccharide/colanic/teichoic acid biosynthesis glycosyltransferase